MAKRISPDLLDPRTNLQLYTREVLKNADVWTNQQVRAEYARLRAVAQKRLKSLAMYEPESYAYRHNVDKYAPTKSLTTEEVRAALPELARFIAAKMGTVAGIRRQRTLAVQTLQEQGYTGISKANLREFGEFMEHYREKKLSHVLSSPSAVEFFEFTQEHEIPWSTIKEDFSQWLRARKDLEKYVKKQSANGQEVTADMILGEFDRLENARKKRNEQARKRRAAKKK